MQHILPDWREIDEPDVIDERERVEPLVLTIEVKPGAIDITLPDGRAIWIENDKGVLVVHAYDADHDEPVNLRIAKGLVIIDTQDRDDLPPRESVGRNHAEV